MRCKACNRVLEKSDWYPQDEDAHEEDLCGVCRSKSEFSDFPTNYVHENDSENSFLDVFEENL